MAKFNKKASLEPLLEMLEMLLVRFRKRGKLIGPWNVWPLLDVDGANELPQAQLYGQS
jgi:hypothetical protein